MMLSGKLGTVEKEKAMQATKTVILWGREDPLGRGVEYFLANRKGWEVIRITDTADTDNLFEAVEKVKPDCIILYQGDCASETDLPAQLMKECPKLKVIVVSLENNSLEVYNKQKVWVKDVSDLFSIVEA